MGGRPPFDGDACARAEMRLAEEYDAAQDRGEVASRGGERSGLQHSPVAPTVADLGIRRDEIHEARKFRDAEIENPGIISRTIDGMVERGEEPTRADLGIRLAQTLLPNIVPARA